MRRLFARRWIAVVVAEGLLLSFLAPLAYYQMFSVFASYDDEGCMMLTVRHVLSGHRLYDEVSTLYGPVYFFYKWLIHGLCGFPLTHDTVRLTAIAVRLLTGAVAAIPAFGLTGSAVFAAAAQILVTFHLVTIDSEPGHPQELCGLLTMVVIAIPCVVGTRRTVRTCVALGLVIAALSMVKINLGIFAGLAVWMSLLSLMPLTGTSALLRIVSTAALGVLPFVLMRQLLGQPQVQNFAATETLAVLATSTIALTRRSGDLALRDLLALASAWAGGVVLMALVLCLSGATVAGLLNSVVVAASRMPVLLVFLPPQFFPSSLAAAAAVALAVGVRVTERSRIGPHLVGCAKLAFGVAALNASWGYDFPTLLSGLTPFVWLGLVPPAGVPVDARQRLARLVLCWVAVLEPLQAFPVAGSQAYFGTVMHAVVGVVCLADGMSWLGSLWWVLAWLPLRAAVAGIVLLALTHSGVSQLRASREGYAGSVPLDLPGATRLRLPAVQVKTLRALTETLHDRADTFFCVPGFSSLYFWTGKEPPTLDVIGHMTNLSDERQVAIVSALLQHQSPMVVNFRGLTPNYPPFQERLRQSFKPMTQVGPYKLLVPR